jgi:hypothetical protein
MVCHGTAATRRDEPRRFRIPSILRQALSPSLHLTANHLQARARMKSRLPGFLRAQIRPSCEHLPLALRLHCTALARRLSIVNTCLPGKPRSSQSPTPADPSAHISTWPVTARHFHFASFASFFPIYYFRLAKAFTRSFLRDDFSSSLHWTLRPLTTASRSNSLVRRFFCVCVGNTRGYLLSSAPPDCRRCDHARFPLNATDETRVSMDSL